MSFFLERSWTGGITFIQSTQMGFLVCTRKQKQKMKWTHFLFSFRPGSNSSFLGPWSPPILTEAGPAAQCLSALAFLTASSPRGGLGPLWSSYATQSNGVSSDEDFWSLILQPQHMLLKWATCSVCHMSVHRLNSSACFWSPCLSCPLVHSPLRCPVALAYNLVCCASRMLIFCHRPWDRLFCC